jgi:predicted DNA repair protein MutK
VVWAVAKGSLVNKAILVPAALLISCAGAVADHPAADAGRRLPVLRGLREARAQVPALEAEEEAEHHETLEALADPNVDLVAFEKEKIKGAVRTDFILSAEIVVITLGTVAAASLGQRVAVLVGISLVMTVGVYGLVAGIVKLDDLGLHLQRSASAFTRRIGGAILGFAPWLMKTLSVVGTAAMFMVGGGILLHGFGGVCGALINTAAGAGVGIVAGAMVLAAVMLVQKLRAKA